MVSVPGCGVTAVCTAGCPQQELSIYQGLASIGAELTSKELGTSPAPGTALSKGLSVFNSGPDTACNLACRGLADNVSLL
jgi:hypothetical protein